MIKPLKYRILLQPEKKEGVTSSGIVLPDDDKAPQTAIVILKGSSVTAPVEIGDKVLFRKYAPDEFEYEGEKYLLCEEDDILAVFDTT